MAVLEALVGAVRGGLGRVQQAVAAQHLGDGRGGGHVLQPQVVQAARQLAPAPGRVGLAQGDDLGLHGRGAAAGAVMRAARAVVQARLALLPITAQQAVARLTADAEAAA